MSDIKCSAVSNRSKHLVNLALERESRASSEENGTNESNDGFLNNVPLQTNHILVYDMNTNTLITRELDESDIGETVVVHKLPPQIDNDVGLDLIDETEVLVDNLVKEGNGPDFICDDTIVNRKRSCEDLDISLPSLLQSASEDMPLPANILSSQENDNNSDVSIVEDRLNDYFQDDNSENNVDLNHTSKKRKKFDISLKERKKMKTEQTKIKHSVQQVACQNPDSYCKKKCGSKINELRRACINNQFWDLQWSERRQFILSLCEKAEVKRRRVKPNDAERRTLSIRYYLKDEGDLPHEVCKSFFLTTLGYKKTNDRFVHYTLTNTPKGALTPPGDKRGKQPSNNKGPHDQIIQHIETFNPTISHYRREHAPNVRYLPGDVNVALMHCDFLEKFPEFRGRVSYDLYRRIVKEQRISFAKLGHEECEKCEEFALHGHAKENLIEGCNQCEMFKIHNELFIEARVAYKAFSEEEMPDGTICFSADMQKIIMLPRVDVFKKVLFIKRLIAYHETFAPVGKKSKLKVHSMLWHEGISGRNKEDNISALYMFLKQHRDAEKIILWLDNCSSQNKNWCLFTFLVYMVNSGEIMAKEIILHFFQPGHSFMSADSFHHQVEMSLKLQKKTYDFEDFVTAVKKSNSGNVEVFTMQHSDFFYWSTHVSQQKLKVSPRIYLNDIVEIKAERGNYCLLCKTNYDKTSPYQQLDFLKKKMMKGIRSPNPHTAPCGFPKEKRDNILQSLSGVLPENRQQFWRNLPTPQEQE